MDWFLKGGFGFLILRELLSNVRQVFSNRRATVTLARSLKQEVDFSTERILEFYKGIEDLIQSNTGKQPQNFTYRPSFRQPMQSVFRQNIYSIYELGIKYEPEFQIKINKFYDCVEGYRILLGYYQDTFMGPNPLSYTRI